MHKKAAAYWLSKISSSGSDSRRVWRTVNSLLGEKKNDVPPVFSATDFHDYIDEKISSIRSASSSAIAAAFKDHRCSELLQFKEVTLRK